MGYQSDVIHCYEQIAALTEHMVALARAANWEELTAVELQFSARVAYLKTIEQGPDAVDALDASQLAHKHRLLKRILADDAEIRDNISPKLAQLSALMGSLKRQQALNQAYGR